MSERARTLKMLTYIELSGKKFKKYKALAKERLRRFPLTENSTPKFQTNVIDLLSRHGRELQTQRLIIDLWIQLLPFLPLGCIEKTMCGCAMTLFLVMENEAVVHPERQPIYRYSPKVLPKVESLGEPNALEKGICDLQIVSRRSLDEDVE